MNGQSIPKHYFQHLLEVYFVHSYRAKPSNDEIIVASADYGIKVPAVVDDKIFFGTQFHPEKSGKVGSLMIKNFLRVCTK